MLKHAQRCAGLLLALSATAVAQQPLQGPQWNRPPQTLDITGEIIAKGAPLRGQPCVQLRVLPDVRFSGGRVWVCDPSVGQYNMLDRLHVRGKATDTRLTKMGNLRRVVPMITNPTVRKIK